ncbi:MAG TPA: bifunctional oligoribonuclease/PAP phosphatase NrnA, partial [Candidatus Goldiibacteriota bacterium]|nr:bifunctional oligoribonuclease/PAP phosphatase NrnA [Candidatus Goldiibacteriota bacterium]
MKSSDVKKLREVFKNSGSILLTTHRNPDGDGIGSGLALMRSLKSMGKHVDFVTRDPVPAIYSFLPLSEKVINLAEVKKHYDLIVFLECPDADRCGRIIDYKKYGKLTVNIDHHLGNEMYADVNVVEPTAAAVGMQLYSFMNSAGWKIDRKTAECLYSAIITDTGSFNYSNTTPEVHEAAAGLIRAGARPAHISSEVYSTTDSSVKLLSAMMSRMRLESGICWSVLTRKMFKRTGAADSETDNFINTLRNVRQARIAVLFKEFGPRTVKVSFRSKTGLDVNYIAKLFDGGGHKYAAGCVVRKP